MRTRQLLMLRFRNPLSRIVQEYGDVDMTPERLKELVAKGEDLDIDFKECKNDLNKTVFETVSSFSNRYGGHLFLGVANDGKLLGVNPEASNRIQVQFTDLLNNPTKISPSLFLRLEEVEVDGKLILYVYVPYSSQVVLCNGKIYDRSGAADIDVTKSTDLAGNLYARKSSLFSEREVFPYVKLDDLRLELIPIVKQKASSRDQNHPWINMDSMDFFMSAGLYEEDKRTGIKGFNLAGVLLFGRDEVIRSCAPGFMTDCLLRRDNIDRYDDRRTIGTNLIEAFDQIMKFIYEYTMDRFFLIGTQSVSVRSLIARELVSNILAHREYSIPAMSRVIIEKDRIVAENPNRSQIFGKLEPGNFTPRSKNPTIARFFVNIGYADELGSGMRNLYNFTDIYTNGATPELVEGDTFKTTIPLLASETETMVNPLNQPANSLRESLGPLTNKLNSFKDSLGPLVTPHWLNQLRESLGPLTNMLNSFKDSLGPLTNQLNSFKDSLGPFVSPLRIPLDTHKDQLNSPIIPFDLYKDQSEPIENELNSLLDTLDPRLKLLKDELTKVEQVFLDALLPYFINNEWINATKVKECLGVSQNSPATVRRRMKRLVDIGILEREGTTRNRKYRLVGSKKNSPSVVTAK